MRSLPLLLLPLLAACDQPEPTIGGDRDYIAPAHRQTRVPSDLPLLVAVRDLLIPPDYPAGELLHVVDVGSESAVAGEVIVEPGAVWFVPESDWEPGHRYLWTVDRAETVPHGPEYGLPNTLIGTAVFEVDDRLDLVGATLERTTDPCFVFSQPVDDRPIEAMELSVEGQPVAVASVFFPGVEWWKEPYELLPEDRGIDMVCMTTEDLLAPDVPVTVTWEDREWTVRMERRRPGDLVASELRRSP